MLTVASRASAAPVGNSPSSGLDPVHPVTQAMVKLTAAAARKPAPDFDLQDASGKNWNFASLSQGKPVYLYFILDGCPCSTSAEPLFHDLYKKYQGKIAFAGVIWDSPKAAAQWAKGHETPYPVLADPKLKAIHAFKATNSVFSLLIMPDRTIEKMWPGYSQDLLRDISSNLARAADVPDTPFDPRYAPLKKSSGCYFPVG